MHYPVQVSSQLRQHLRALRKARGLTQAALGKRVGVGQARIAEIENNPGVVGVDQLMALLSAMGASLALQDDASPSPAATETGPPPPSDAAARHTPRPPDANMAAPAQDRPAPLPAPQAAQTLGEALAAYDIQPRPRPRPAIPPKKGSW